MIERLRNYFIGKQLAVTTDVFEYAKTVMMYRFLWVFAIVFLMPIGMEISMEFYRALTLHIFDFAFILLAFVLTRKGINVNLLINLFMLVGVISALFANMIYNPTGIDVVGLTWLIFFMILGILLQTGWNRILCHIGLWIPLLYAYINLQTGGELTVSWMVEDGNDEVPYVILIIPMILIIHTMWNYASTLRVARKTITEQKKEIEEKNKDITDSIVYAKRIQEAILPSPELINAWLRESFVLYKPKEIVAGDFYWIENIDNLIYFAVVDCTGHGVPGAMVSMVGHNSLNRALREFELREPSKILDRLSVLVEETFEKSGHDIKDGMDIALCCIDRIKQEIAYAGANNSLYVIKSGILEEIKGDKQPVGKFATRKPFSGHTIRYNKGDCFYIFTDGFADQFGGEKGKKFKYIQFKELLQNIHQKKMSEQKTILDSTIEEWRGKLEQVDDVCVLGVQM